MLVSEGFGYLCRKYGKSDIAPHEAGHDAMMNEMKARLDNIAR